MRAPTTDAPRGPKPASPVLTAQAAASAGAFRQHTLLPLDEGRYALQETSPYPARSALHRLCQRHGRRRLPGPEPADKKKHFTASPLG